jgi:regulator of RNase E activity RraA
MDLTFKAQGGKLIRDIPRPDSALVQELGRIPTSILSDCLDRLQTFAGLCSVGPPRTFAGVAFTVEEIEAGNLMSHMALKYVRDGDVLVIDGKGVTSRACWGGLQTFAAARKGVRAVIIDGAVRDVDDIHKFGVPVYCRGVSPAGPHKGWGGRVNIAIQCGGAVVHPGDAIVGDADGLVVVPCERAAATLSAARAKMEVEAAWFKKVEAGADTADFLGLADQARALGIEIV